ncbi:MAG: dipeptide epimerase [Lewinellaceae bacterium]|nr:dipeptide epimerase [Saprospiraceae bacterium]MCB9338294.1 dipeptide epimerase [Lewinellaceae bacterium]
MKITHLECWLLEMPLTVPYTIAYEKIEQCVNVILKIDTDTGLTGWGCAAPDLPVTGETPKGVLHDFEHAIAPWLKGMNPFRYTLIDRELQQVLPKSLSARTMADMAIYDLMAQQAKVPLYQLLGGYRESIPTSITIGILPVEDTLAKAKDFIRQGFFILKIKGGKDVEEDIEKMVKLRETLGHAIELRFDANQGYTVEQSVRFIKETMDVGIELFEQPTAGTASELLGEVTSKVPIPVMADESLLSLKDVFHLTSNNWTDMINIKLMKTGGITQALHINSVAKAAGVEAMVGCMDESALSIAAGLHFALGRHNVKYADLDGHLDLLEDPFAGLVILKNGVLYPAEGNGLGVAQR